MNKSTFYIGMGMGLVAGSVAMYAMRPKKSEVRTLVGKTLKTVGEVMGEAADTVSELLGL